MTEAEWRACGDPDRLLRLLGGALTARKARLFACACARRAWRLLVEPASRGAVEGGEAFADGRLGAAALEALWSDADEARDLLDRASNLAYSLEAGTSRDDDEYDPAELAFAARGVAFANAAADASEAAHDCAVAADVLRACDLVYYAAQAVRHAVGWERRVGAADSTPDAGAEADESAQQFALLRDLFLRPVTVGPPEPAWLTSTVMSLARAAYDERSLPSGELDRVRMGILADALEEAGCADDVLLSHLRCAGPHVRGCWALDLVLGKQ